MPPPPSHIKSIFFLNINEILLLTLSKRLIDTVASCKFPLKFLLLQTALPVIASLNGPVVLRKEISLLKNITIIQGWESYCIELLR